MEQSRAMTSRGRALLFCLVAAALSGSALVVACASDDPSAQSATDTDASADAERTGDDDAASATDAHAPSDAGADARDAAAAKKDANGPGAPDADCALNADCQAALRCACTEATGCSCQPGARGTGQNGIDVCDAGANGADCESALCIEGPNGSYYCSDSCQTNADCMGQLPKCTNIAFVGQICVRDPAK